MAILENNGRKLKEVHSKSRKEFEEDIRWNALDMLPGMEVYLDQDDMALFDDWTSIGLPDETPSITASEKKPTIKPLEKGSTLKPLETESTPKQLDKKPASRPEIWLPVIPFDNLHPSRPSIKWPPIEKSPTMRPLDHLPPVKTINETTLEDYYYKHVNRKWDLPKYNYKFVYEQPTPPPAAHTGADIMKVIGCVVAGFVALLIIATLRDKKNWTRRGVVLAAGAAAADQEILIERRPSDPGEPGPFTADLPPPYYECVPHIMNNDEVPPPYTYPEGGVPREDAFIENELRASSAGGAPDMRTDLVFDNGRIAERLSLDLDRNNHTGVTSSDNVEGQSTTHAEFKDRVLYVDETGNVKGHTQ